MTPLEFLAEVLPSPGNGYYCAAELTNKKEHVFKETLEELLPTIERWSAKGYDTYFALGTFGTSKDRTKDNMHASQVLAVDLDCNHAKDIPQPDKDTGELVIKPKSYPSAKAAAQALQKFCEDTGLAALGDPWVVHSGGGIHAYWPLNEMMFKEDWFPLAKRFKELCHKHGLKIDNAVTGDASRVLRVFDTTNTGVKNGKRVREPTKVRFISEGNRFAVDDLDAILTTEGFGHNVVAQRPTSSLMLPGQRPTSVSHISPTAQAIIGNSITRFKKLLLKTRDGSGCGQIAHYLENAQEDGTEPLWRGLLSWTKVCVDGEKAAIWLSDKHPYDHDRMYRKLHEIKGPYSCEAMNDANPGVCGKCQHRGKITNPLGWGRELNSVTEAVEIEVQVEDAAPQKVYRPEPPRGYAFGRYGGVFIEKEEDDGDGNVNKRQHMLLPYDLFPVDILNNNGIHEIHMLAVRKDHVQEVLLPQKSIAARDDALKHLASQNIMASFGSGNDKNLYEYVRASVEKMSTEKSPIRIPSAYGWQDDDSFVFNSTIFKAGADPVFVPMAGLENIVSNTKPTGSLDEWRKVINMMVRRKLWKHLTVFLAGAASPLMRFTGLFGVTMHCASAESGTGKSLALDAAASIWGHPVHYRTGSGTSAVAMQQRLGLLRSLPLVTDEITTNNRNDFEWFPAFLFSMSEGRGKERMESGTNRERLNLSIWAAFALMSSNRPAVDYLTSVRQHSSEGELRRLIEMSMDEKLSWDADEIEIIKSLQSNYAVAGEVLSRYFVNNIEYIKTLVPQTVAQMYKEFGAPNDERFWMAGAGIIIAAGVILNSQHTGLVDIPLQEIIGVLRNTFENQRASIAGGKRTAEDVLNAYVQEYQGKLVVVKFGERAGVMAAFSDGSIVGRNTTRSEVMGRVEHGATIGNIDLYIEERLLRAYCSAMSFSYATFREQLSRSFRVSYVQRKDLMAKTDGPPMRVRALQITRRIDEEDDVLTLPTLVPVAIS
jgi:hypothetical protein